MKIQPFTNPQLLFRPSSGQNAATSPKLSSPLFADRLSLVMKDSRTLVTGQLGQSLIQSAPHEKFKTLSASSNLLIPQPPTGQKESPVVTNAQPLEEDWIPEQLQTTKLKPMPPAEGSKLLIPQPPAGEKESPIGVEEQAEMGTLLVLQPTPAEKDESLIMANVQLLEEDWTPEQVQTTKLRPMPPAEGSKLLIPQPPAGQK